jgi:clan AA aspartic protease (TIGR02281 family)
MGHCQKIILSFISLIAFVFSSSYAQTSILMEKTGGVYKIPCKVNGLDLKFIFDTGASDVSLSLAESIFMLKNGYISENDFLGTEYYRIANGDIQEGTKVNLKVLEVGGQKIYNVQASISHSLNAPLLFGQSALQRFGKFSIDYSTNILSLGVNKNGGIATNRTTSTQDNKIQIICKDIDGNIYKTVIVGDILWMAENLKTTRFNNGDTIVEDNTVGYIDYGTREKDKRGKISQGHLYNWYTVSEQRNVCPKGWYIPSRDDVVELTNYYGLVGDRDGESYIGEGNVLENLLSSDKYWTSSLNGSSSSYLFDNRPTESRLIIYYKNNVEFNFLRCIKNLSEKGYYESGIEKAKLGDYDGAIKDFTKAIEINPNNKNTYYNQALVKSKLKNSNGAIEDLSKAIILDLRYVEAWIMRGIFREDIKDYSGAIKDFTIALELKPNNASILLFRGNAKSNSKDYKSAIEDFNKAIEINIDYAEAYYYRGIAKCSLGQKGDGCLDLRKAQELGEDSKIAIEKNCR